MGASQGRFLSKSERKRERETRVAVVVLLSLCFPLQPAFPSFRLSHFHPSPSLLSFCWRCPPRRGRWRRWQRCGGRTWSTSRCAAAPEARGGRNKELFIPFFFRYRGLCLDLGLFQGGRFHFWPPFPRSLDHFFLFFFPLPSS